jgi:vacuolar-type H+-ATPase subunit I/STV1
MKSPLGRIIGGMSQESKDALREIRKAVIRSIGDDKYFTSLTPLNTTTFTKTDRDTGEKREVLGNITVKNSASNLTESIEKDLADINKEAEHEVLQNKLDKIDVLIDKRKSQLGRLDEDEDMKALTDKKKVKELERDIKKLEAARKKVEKMLHKTKGKKKEILDEVGEDSDNLELMKAVSQAQEMYNGGLDIDDILVKFNPRMRNDIESYLTK